jgi:hypothetical protein
MGRKLFKLADGCIVDISYMYEGESPVVYTYPDVGWVPFRGNIDEIFKGIPVSDDEMWQMVASGDLDLLKNITLEARMRIRQLEKIFEQVYPEETPGARRELALHKFFSEKMTNEKGTL